MKEIFRPKWDFERESRIVCGKCGEELDILKSYDFCPNCGAEIDWRGV